VLQDEVERMVGEAERFATEDKSKREAVETKNNAESLVYQTEKQIKELGDKVPADVKTKLDDKIKAVRCAAGALFEVCMS
jgi:molecular chaperone DnaK (HSP70)